MVKIGQKIKFSGDKKSFKVQAFDERYIVLTRPFNLKKTYQYTIVDLERKVRGACNLIFGLPPECECDTPEGAKNVLKWLRGFEDDMGFHQMEVSYRNVVDLTLGDMAQIKG